MRENISVRQWQENFRAGAYDSRDTATQCAAGWGDWFCQNDALADRLKEIALVVTGITDPFILDNFCVWFKNNCPADGPLYDDVRFQPLSGERNGQYFLVVKDCPYEEEKWVLYTERHGLDTPDHACENVRDMVNRLDELGPELAQVEPSKPSRSKAPRRKEAER